MTKSNYIKGLLRMRGLDMSRLAQELQLPYGTVVNTINGYRSNPEVRRKIAAFLGEPAAELFGDFPGHASQDTSPEAAALSKNTAANPGG
jgi:lambda repressor-like predicted transcriptional regulator